MKKLPKPTNKVIKDVVPSSFSTAITKSVIPIDDPSPSSSSSAYKFHFMAIEKVIDFSFTHFFGLSIE